MARGEKRNRKKIDSWSDDLGGSNLSQGQLALSLVNWILMSLALTQTRCHVEPSSLVKYYPSFNTLGFNSNVSGQVCLVGSF